MANTRGFVPRGRTGRARELVPTQVRIITPYFGFTPDVTYHVTGVTGAISWVGLWVQGESITTNDGFEHILANGAEPIFGNDDDAVGYTEVTTLNTWGTGVTAAADQVQPPAVIGWYFDERGGAAAQHTSAFIITFVGTKQAPAIGPPHNEYNHFFTRDLSLTTNLWVSREFTSNAIGTVDSPPRWTVDEPIDFAIWDLPLPTSGSTSVANPPLVLWGSLESGVTDGGGTVCYFPQTDAGTSYSNMSSYATELDNAAMAAGDVRQDLSVRFGIGARSLTVFDGRAMYLNIVETASFVRRPRRVRWSVIGNPFILDQGYSSASNSQNGVGAGFLDLDEFSGEGVKIEVLGDVVVCYMEDGVAFLRRTQQPLAAFEREIVARQRALLGVRALVSTGDGLHFGIFSDGWFYLDEAGRWKEAGVVTQGGAGEQPRRLFKWKERFYTFLNRNHSAKTAITYDQARQMIKVVWAQGQAATGLNTVWTYDVANDRVYPDDLTDDAPIQGSPLVAYTQDRTPSCWGSVPADIHGSTLPSWVLANNRIVVHGAIDGSVYAHDEIIPEYDGDDINWGVTFQWTSSELDPFVVKTLDKLWLEYTALGVGGGFATSARVSVLADSGVGSTATVPLTTTTASNLLIARMVPTTTLRLPGHAHQITILGVGQVRILSLRAQVTVEESRGLGAQPLQSRGTPI